MKNFTKQEFLIFLAIFFFGTFLRLYHLDYPLGLHGDEAWTGIEAQRILSAGSIGIWSFGGNGQPTLPFYWTAFIFKLFGIDIFTLRLSFSLLSIFSLPFFYFIARSLFSKKVALIAFFLFATARVPIHFSHIAYTSYLAPFLPAVFFFLIAIKNQNKIFFVLAGVFVGIAPYFAPGLRILPLLLLVSFLYYFFQKNLKTSQIKKFLILIFSSIIVALPLLYFSFTHQEIFWGRTNAVSIFSSQGNRHIRASTYGEKNMTEIILEQIKTTALMFNTKGDGDSQDNYQNLPLFDFLTGIFFILGLVASLRQMRSGSTIFLFLWFLIFLSGTIFTVDAPNFRRVQPSIAAAYIFVAIGMVWFLENIQKYVKQKIIIFGITILVCCSIAYTNIQMYFLKQGISEETKQTFSYPLIKAAAFLNEAPQPTYVYFYSSNWPYRYESLSFLTSVPGEDRSKQFGTYSLINGSTKKTMVYLFLPDYQESFYQVQKIYPGGKVIIKKDTNGTILFYSYIVFNNL